MDFYALLDQVVALLHSRGRVSYRALKRQFNLDDEYLEDLKTELIQAQRLARDEEGVVLVWTGMTGITPEPTATHTPPALQDAMPEGQPSRLEAPRPERHAAHAERRQLTVMFSDLVDSTQLSGQLDPEDYRDVVRAYQATCAEVIQRFEGSIAQHLGDALLVYFGYPQAHEDDAQRAIRAGLGMLQAMQTLNTRLERQRGMRLAMRIGIHTGLTVVGDIGEGWKHEYLALGETPNVASRLQGVAAPDTIALSAATYRLVQGCFDCQALGDQTLKGVAQPMRVYRVLRERWGQSRFDLTRVGGLTPLVGREPQLGLLLERWEQVKAQQGQVILLSGEAGIGKSRLVQVFTDHVSREAQTRWECRSSPYYQHTALYPLTDCLHRALRWQPDERPAEKLETLEQMLSQYGLSAAEAVPLLAPLLSLPLPADRYPPLRLSSQRQRQKTLETILSLLLARAARQPVLFILEDVHWTDPSTLELLGMLIEQVPTAAMLLLLTSRPEFQPPWGSRSYVTPITLNRLSRRQIQQLAERVAGGRRLPAEVLQQIVDKADGVPLFVEELTKAILESGHLREVNGQYELVGSLAALTIPATLQDSLMARLDRLVTAKAVAQYAAVIGRQFSYALLQAVAQLDDATLERELSRLVDAELLYQSGLPPEATYTFKHALITDTAYQSLLRRTRQQYHQRIAQVLEARFPGTIEAQPELLARHCTEAGLTEQALRYWHQAGAHASARSAYTEAIQHLTTGLQLLETLPDTPRGAQYELDLRMTLGPALQAAKGHAAPETGDVFARAWELCKQLGTTPQLVPALLGLWTFYVVRGDYPIARELGEQLLALARRDDNPEYLLAAHFASGSVCFFQGEFLSGREHVEQGLALHPAQPHRGQTLVSGHNPSLGCLTYAAWLSWMLGHPDTACTRMHQALTMARELAHPFNLVRVLVWAALLAQFRREAQRVQEYAQEALALSTEQGFPFLAVFASIPHGWARAAQGLAPEAIAVLRHSMAAFQTTGGGSLQSYFLALLAEAYGYAGQVKKGLAVLTDALSVVDTTGERFCEAELYRLRGHLLLQLSADNAAQAEADFHQALDIARRQHATSWELRAATSLSRLWQQQGKRSEARGLLTPLYGGCTEGFDTMDLQDARALLDELGA